MSSPTGPIRWASVDPRTNQTVDYDAGVQAELEQAFQNKAPNYKMYVGAMVFTIVFDSMQQFNQSGGSRAVQRLAPETPPVPFAYDAVVAATVLSAIEQIDAAVDELQKHENERHYFAPKGAFDPGRAEIVAVFDAIIDGMKDPAVKARYGYSAGADAFQVRFGDQVPAYFANSTNGNSIYHRKMLSLLGLRNLVQYGPEIFAEMRAKMFSGSEEDYPPKTGPSKMKHFTGSVLDLDTTVLRCTDRATLDAVNASRRMNGEKELRNAEALANSTYGKAMAVQAAGVVIDEFTKRLNLTAAEVAHRRIALDRDPESIHEATGHTDRGKWPIWKYNNVGVLSFHANVPTLNDVYGALLRAPYHLVKAFLLLHQKPVAARAAALADFYENAVVDSCFNAKWKAIEEHVSVLEACGGIDDVLNKFQAAKQKHFTPAFFEADNDECTKELALMVKLANSAKLVGQDPVTKRPRLITKADIAKWINARL
jgi:hypothetical protein